MACDGNAGVANCLKHPVKLRRNFLERIEEFGWLL